MLAEKNSYKESIQDEKSQDNNLFNLVKTILEKNTESKKLLVNLEKNDFDYPLIEGKYKGTTILWWLAGTPEGRELLKKHPELFTQGNLDADPFQGECSGITVLCWLAGTPEGREILAKHLELLEQGNLDAAPSQGKDSGITVLWLLAAMPEGIAILAKYPELLKQGNLDAAPSQGEDSGKTVLWCLAVTPEGRKILIKNPELLKERNLEAAPSQGEDSGKTVLWCLAVTPEGRKILIKNPELLKERNLEAAPSQGEDSGKTVLWCLAVTPEGRKILIKNPELFKERNLEAAPSQKDNADKSVLWQIIDSPERNAILKNPIVAQIILNSGLINHLSVLLSKISEDPGLEKLFIFACANCIKTENEYDNLVKYFKKPENVSLSEQLSKELITGINVLFVNSFLSKIIPNPLRYEIMYFYFFGLHPDLAFIGNPMLKPIIDQKLVFLLDTPLRILSLRSVKAYQAVQNSLQKDEEQTLKKMIVSVLREAILERSLQHCDITSQFSQSFVTSIKNNQVLDKTIIKKAISDSLQSSALSFFNQSVKRAQPSSIENSYVSAIHDEIKFP